MNILIFGKRLVPLEQVAYVEPFDPATNPDFKPEKEYKSRIVLLNREAILAEQAPEPLSTAHGLHFFSDDNVAVNRAIRFKVEIFELTDTFKPTKPYKTRLKWEDDRGDEQSKLLLTEPQIAIAGILEGKREMDPTDEVRPPRRPAKKRSNARRVEPVQT